MIAGENFLGSFLDRKRRWIIYVTDNRIFAVDRSRVLVKSLVSFLIIALSYLLAFGLTLRLQLSIASFVPLIVLIAFFPTLYFAARWLGARSRRAEKTDTPVSKLEIGKTEIDQVEMFEPGVLTARGKLVVRSKSGGVLEFTIVGASQFHQVVGLMRLFTQDSGIVFLAKPKQ